jgi:zinc transport system substrate-binding protein
MPRIRFLLCLALSLIPACGRAPDEAPPPEPLVLVEVAPMVSLVRPLLAEGVEIRPIVPAGTSPHGYQLTPGDARALATASVVITVGPVLEPSINRAVARQTPADRLVSVAETIGLELDPHAGHDHSSHADTEHAHDDHASDPHLWLDPELMDAFVAALPEALRARGVAAPDVDDRAAAVRAEIRAIGDDYAARLAPFAGRAIITHHDAFRRVADRYGLAIAQVIRPISGVEPTPGDLSRVREAVAAAGVGAIFVEPQFPDALPRRIAAQLGLEVHSLIPEGSDDWAAMMRANLDALVAGLSAPVPQVSGG